MAAKEGYFSLLISSPNTPISSLLIMLGLFAYPMLISRFEVTYTTYTPFSLLKWRRLEFTRYWKIDDEVFFFLGLCFLLFAINLCMNMFLNFIMQLYEVPGLAERMAALMCVDVDLNSAAEEAGEEDCSKLSAAEIVEREMHKVNEGRDDTRWLELEELDIDDDMLVSLDLPSKFPVRLLYSSKM